MKREGKGEHGSREYTNQREWSETTRARQKYSIALSLHSFYSIECEGQSDGSEKRER